MIQNRTLVIIFLILALSICCLPAGAALQSYSFRGSVINVSESDNTVTILVTHKWGCVYDGSAQPCTWRTITPTKLTGTVPVPEVFDNIRVGSSVMAGSIGLQGKTWTGIGILTPPYGTEPLHATWLYGELNLLPAPLVAGYDLAVTMQPDCGECSGAICTAQAANLTLSRDGAEVWTGNLLPGEEAVYEDPLDGSGLSVLFVSGEASSHLCPDTPPGMTGIQPTSIFIVHADQPRVGPVPTRAGTGSLKVNSIPFGASILLDGIAKGVTPDTISNLEPGVYTLVLEKEGYADYQKNVTVAAGRLTTVTATLSPLSGSLQVKSSPSNATVLLNGAPAGITPLIVDNLVPGAYSVSISKSGYQTTNSTATVVAGQQKLLFVTLPPKKDVPEKIDVFIAELEKEGFTVQKGKFEKFDVISMYNAGIVPGCFGNNPSTPYLVEKLPPYPGLVRGGLVTDAPINPANQGLWLDYFMEPDEAIVYVGQTPPEAKYFSYRSYISNRWIPEKNEFMQIFASFGDQINNFRIHTGTSPGQFSSGPYDKPVMIITTADKGTNGLVKNAAMKAGYSTSMINDDIIPSGLVRMGTGNTSDTFTFIHRVAFFANETLGKDYINSTPGTVLRLTPNASKVLQPYGVPPLIVRGTGDTRELDLLKDQEALRAAIIARMGNGKVVTENKTGIFIFEGYDSLQRESSAQGDNRDTVYLANGNYTLSGDESIVIYGVNHQKTGKATYTNAAVYGANALNGVAAVTDSDYAGSAESYLPGNPDSGLFYVWKFSLHCNGEDGCTEVPSCCGGAGIPEGDPVMVGFRAYVEPGTGVGPSWTEILYDQVLHFSPA